MKFSEVIRFAVLAVAAAGYGWAANIVLDPGFEARGAGVCLGSGACSAGSPAWVFIDAASGSSYGIADTLSGGIPRSGTNGAVFQGVTLGSYDSIQQTLPTTAGQAYTLSFWLDTNAGHNGASFQVYWEGALVYDLGAGNDPAHSFPYTQITLAVQATGPNSVLRFSGYNAPSYDFFDDVSVDAAVPEPASCLLVGAGVLALGLRQLRRGHPDKS